MGSPKASKETNPIVRSQRVGLPQPEDLSVRALREIVTWLCVKMLFLRSGCVEPSKVGSTSQANNAAPKSNSQSQPKREEMESTEIGVVHRHVDAVAIEPTTGDLFIAGCSQMNGNVW
jgi:hypothetical protein